MLVDALSEPLDHLAVVDGGFEGVHGFCSWESLLSFPMLRSILQALGLHDDVECAHGSCPRSCSEKSLLGSSMLMEGDGLGLHCGGVECVGHGLCSWKSLLGLRADVGGEAECVHGSCHRGCES